MSNAIICCSCGSTPDYCKKSLAIIYPERKDAPTYIGSKVKELVGKVPDDSEMGRKLSTLVGRRGRYGEYYEWDEAGNIVEAWNLLRSRRLA